MRSFIASAPLAHRVGRMARTAQTGFSLVELMVAMVVGLMVIGALLSTFYVTSVTGRHGQALSQMTEDASVAMNMLRSQLSQVGYSRPVGLGANKFVPAYTGAGMNGCDSSFTDTGVAIAALACEDSSDDDDLQDSIAVAYEADARNSVVSGGVPLDCLGNALTIVAGANPYYQAYNRFYLDTPDGATRRALYCRGPGNNSAQALVENIEDMQIRYGVTNKFDVTPVQVARYASASSLANNFANVVSVRVCLVVASTNEVLDAPTSYVNCQQQVKAPADRRMYRAFTSTVVLQNRLGVL